MCRLCQFAPVAITLSYPFEGPPPPPPGGLDNADDSKCNEFHCQWQLCLVLLLIALRCYSSPPHT
jgi:hypothetical protein